MEPTQSLEVEDDMMKLLRGKTDSQRLAGLLLVSKKFSNTKNNNNNDNNHQTILLNVYNALGSTFLHRLLLTGIGKDDKDDDNKNPNREAYLRLSLAVLAAFVRVPQIAASQDMLAKIPLVLKAMSYYQSGSSEIEDSYEFLFLVSTAHEDGVITLYESGGMNVLASLMPSLPDGSQMMELSMKLVKLIISKIPAEKVFAEHPAELSKMVVAIAKQFALLHNALKFEALHLLSTILSSDYKVALHAVLQSVLCDDWSSSIRVGIMAVLQNRVAPAEKLQALILAECVISIVGEDWLIGRTTLPDAHGSFPADRCILLVLESSRVEIAVLLNELAFLKYEASRSTPPNTEGFLEKLRNLGVAFALVERIIKLISSLGENEEPNSASIISESTFSKIIGGLNETIGLVLDYLQDAKEHGQRKGDDLLASVRIVGSYLAEAPCACKEKIEQLLGYMLSVEGKDELSPFCSISFLLPLMCQITMMRDGCIIFASSGAFETVVEFLVAWIDSNGSKIENSSSIFLVCDTILNFLLKKEHVHFAFENSSSVKLLQALARWTEDSVDPSVIMMASSICALILGSTCEEALLRHPEFNSDNLIELSQLMKRSLVTCGQDEEADNVNTSSEADLHEIVKSGYSSWADRFPHIKQVVER